MSIISIRDVEKNVNSALATKIKSSIITFDQLTINVEVENLYSTILFLKAALIKLSWIIIFSFKNSTG